MASVSMAIMAVPVAGVNKQATLFNPLQKKAVVGSGRKFSRLQVKASLKEKVVVAATSAVVTASMVVPQVAEAAVSPSLKNYLLSIVSGGVVAVAIVGAVIGVSYFDPVKRG